LEIIALRNEFEQTTDAIQQEVEASERVWKEIELMKEETLHFEEKIKNKIRKRIQLEQSIQEKKVLIQWHKTQLEEYHMNSSCIMEEIASLKAAQQLERYPLSFDSAFIHHTTEKPS